MMAKVKLPEFKDCLVWEYVEDGTFCMAICNFLIFRVLIISLISEMKRENPIDQNELDVGIEVLFKQSNN